MKNNLWIYLGCSLLALLVASAIFATALAPHNPNRQNLDDDLQDMTDPHPVGTDQLDRDILSRTSFGGRISLLVGVSTVAISLSIGLFIGSISGYFGGWLDHLLMRAVDI